MYSQIIRVDDELRDIIEDGVGFPVDPEVMVVDRKSRTESQRKIYRNHHKVYEILVEALPHSEYTKIVDKSTAKAIFESLCSTYERNKQMKKAKANMLVQHYELFRMKEDGDNETSISRFQTLIFGLQVLNKSYTTLDHVKKIFASLPAKWRPKVNVIKKANDLNKLNIKKVKLHHRSFMLEVCNRLVL